MATFRTRQVASRGAHKTAAAIASMSSRNLRKLLTAFIGFVMVVTILKVTRERLHDSSFVRYTAPAMVSGAEPGPQAAEEHFSPAENLEQLDIARIRQAQHTLDIAMYAFTDKFLADAIVERARAGVQVRIYRDRSQFEQEEGRSNSKRESTTAQFDGEKNIHIKVKNSHELMHLKAYLIDQQMLRAGSANWSPSGLKRQDNNAHFCTDPQQIKAFQGTFEEMWNRQDNKEVQ
jgi:phosphatidylserine/phosphatidylglycerophosphate/cardiolipin synthase-like enzyme